MPSNFKFKLRRFQKLTVRFQLQKEAGSEYWFGVCEEAPMSILTADLKQTVRDMWHLAKYVLKDTQQIFNYDVSHYTESGTDDVIYIIYLY